MLKRIWRGEISLGWAFWGIGLGGSFILFAVLSGFVGIAAVGVIVKDIKGLGLPIRILGGQATLGYGFLSIIIFLALVSAFAVPAIVIWRSATRNSSKLWRRLAKSYVVFGGSTALLAPPIGFVILSLSYIEDALTPEFYENTTELKADAPGFFKDHTGLDTPNGATIAHVVFERPAVMDYEATHQLILDAKEIDLKAWIKMVRPFGLEFVRTVPKPSLEWRSDGLRCSDRQRSLTGQVCDLVAHPREVWHLTKRLRSDRVVTLIVLEEQKLIWLSEANW